MPLVFKLEFDLHDLLFFLSELARCLCNFKFEFFFKLYDAVFSLLQIESLGTQLALICGDLGDCFVELGVASMLFLPPVTRNLLNSIDLLLFQVREELRHLSPLPHFELPGNLVISWLLRGNLLGCSSTGRSFSSRNSKVFQVHNYTNKALRLVKLLDWQVLVAHSHHRRI